MKDSINISPSARSFKQLDKLVQFMGDDLAGKFGGGGRLDVASLYTICETTKVILLYIRGELC